LTLHMLRSGSRNACAVLRLPAYPQESSHIVQNNMATRNPPNVRRQSQQAVTVRLIYVEPSEDERAVTERMWAMLLGEPENDGEVKNVISRGEKPA
jgi:hypothetical protein